MMSDVDIDLRPIFCREAYERLERAAGATGTQEDPHAAIAAYNLVHQEFDSLHGAARAANLPEWMRAGRSLARYARYLRNRVPHGVAEEEHDRLRRAVDLAFNHRQAICGSEPCRELAEFLTLVDAIELALENGGA